MAAGARTFIGGIINLLIGASEEVFKCFWKTVLTSSRPMGLALRGCEKANYPVANAHGISGDMGKFKAGFVVPAKVKEKPKAKATGAAKSGAKGKGAAKSRAKAKGAAKATGKAKAKGKPRKGAKSTKGR
jgi:hypothetical protein